MREPASSPTDSPGRDVSEVRLRNYCLTCGVSVLVSQAQESNVRRPGRGARIGYKRISTISQTLDQQNAALEAAGVAKTFSDTMSGARHDRPGLTALMEYVREGDTVVVRKWDRLGRNSDSMRGQGRVKPPRYASPRPSIGT
jgi:Resolvase, N terminal domain